MAAAFLRDYFPRNVVVSAGRNPSESVDPMAVTVMKECLIDMQDYVPQSIEAVDVKDYDVVYECPDPSCPNTIEAYREMRDFIKNEAYLFGCKLIAGSRKL